MLSNPQSLTSAQPRTGLVPLLWAQNGPHKVLFPRPRGFTGLKSRGNKRYTKNKNPQILHVKKLVVSKDKCLEGKSINIFHKGLISPFSKNSQKSKDQKCHRKWAKDTITIKYTNKHSLLLTAECQRPTGNYIFFSLVTFYYYGVFLKAKKLVQHC